MVKADFLLVIDSVGVTLGDERDRVVGAPAHSYDAVRDVFLTPGRQERYDVANPQAVGIDCGGYHD